MLTTGVKSKRTVTAVTIISMPLMESVSTRVPKGSPNGVLASERNLVCSQKVTDAEFSLQCTTSVF